MQIEPHTVEPGFIKRWTIQAIALLIRSPIIWGIVIACYFFTSRMINSSVWLLFLGGFLLMLSLELACFTDFNKINLNGFLSCIKISIKNYIQYVKDKKIFLIIFTIFMLTLEITKNKSPVKEINISDISIFTSTMYSIIFGYIFLNNGGLLQIFTYPLKRAFDSDNDKAISEICLRATKKNPKVFIFFEVVVFLTLILMGVFLPVAGLFLSIFIPCLIYVAFREIFWGKRKNQKQEEFISQTNNNIRLVKIED